MKRIVLILGFSFILSCSFSQGIFQKSEKGLNLSSELANYGIYLFPNLTIDYKKHSIALGLIILRTLAIIVIISLK